MRNGRSSRLNRFSYGSIPVVIMCGGRGTRLKEETEVIPKPLVNIGGKPLLWHIMKIYYAHGFRNFVLAAGYKGEKIKEYFLNYAALQGDFTVDFTTGNREVVPHSPLKERWKVTVVDTGLDTQTGARLKLLASYLPHPMFLLTYGDGVSNVALNDLVRFHIEQKKIATVTGVHPPARFGEITVEKNSAVSFYEKPQVRQGYINGGFFVLNKAIFQYLNSDADLNFEKDVLPMLAKNNQLSVFCHNGYWQCMDTIRDLEILQEEWAKKSPLWKIWES